MQRWSDDAKGDQRSAEVGSAAPKRWRFASSTVVECISTHFLRTLEILGAKIKAD